jgi:hypothetical protein
MDGRKNIVSDKIFIDQNGVLIVIAFPGHKADEDVAAERNLAVIGGGTVGNDFALFDRSPTA